METQQEPPKHREVQKTPKHVGANGLQDDVMALKVDVAVLKEQGRNFATKEDIARLEVQIAQARAESNENIAKLETQIAQTRAESNENIAKLEIQIAKMRTEFAEHRAESNKNIAKLEVQIVQVRAENNENIAELRAEIAQARNDLLYAVNRATVGMIVALGGILVTLILK